MKESSEYQCPQHGALVLRPKQQQTPEQLWCGEWYDCPEDGRHHIVLERSPELVAQLNGQIRSLKRDFDKLRTKRERDKYLKNCPVEVVKALVDGVFLET
jgi:hypothetical protein